MMHKPVDRHLFLINGNTMTSGGSLNLAQGQLGLFNVRKTTPNGLEAVSTFVGTNKKDEFVFKVGQDNKVKSRTGNTKSNSTFPFKISEVVDVRVSAPTSTKQIVDEMVLGYNGIDENTAITFKKGDRKSIFLELSGNWIGVLGYPDNKVTIEYTMFAENCDPNNECVECDSCDSVESATLVLNAIEYLKNFELRGGVKVSDGVEITPVKSCDTEPAYTEIPYVFQTLSVVDMGDEIALALVQAQYPGYTVTRKDRVGSTSIYEVVTPDGTTLDAYEQTIASILKGCEDCPEDYEAAGGGVMYSVTIVDDGADLTTTVDDLPGFVTGTVLKNGQSGSVGTYSVIVDNELTDAEIATFLAASNAKKTATITKVGVVATVCENDTVTEIDWVEGETCAMSTEDYKITLPDTECGTNRLAELQAAFPNNTVYVNGTSTRAITLTGTSGTANININGTDYLSTFDSDLTDTAANFVTAHAAAILATTGITVTSALAVLTFAFSNINTPTTFTITNATGNLAGTLGTLTAVTSVTGGCQTEYITRQATNLVCDECSDIYKEVFKSEAPANYTGVQWEKVTPTPAYEDCLMGIRFKGKEFLVAPDESLRDYLSFEDSSIKIQASGGYITEVREGIGQIIDSSFKQTYISKWQPRTHMGGNLLAREIESRQYFQGEDRLPTYLERTIAGTNSVIDVTKQYVDVTFEIERNQYAGSNSQKWQTTTGFIIHAEYGKHQDLIALANLVAGAAGLPAVTV